MAKSTIGVGGKKEKSDISLSGSAMWSGSWRRN